MNLGYDVYWCAIRGDAPDVTRIFGPDARVRASTRDDSLEPDAHDIIPTATFAANGWTFFVSPVNELRGVPAEVPDRDVLLFEQVAVMEWSALKLVRGNECMWSVIGDNEKDHLYTTGTLPAEATMDRTRLMEFPVRLAEALTQYRHDKKPRPKGFQIIELPEPKPSRRLVVGDETIEDPSLERVQQSLVAHEGLKLIVGQETLVVTFGDKPRIETRRNRFMAVRREQRPDRAMASAGGDIDAEDAVRLAERFYERGTRSEAYFWITLR